MSIGIIAYDCPTHASAYQFGDLLQAPNHLLRPPFVHHVLHLKDELLFDAVVADLLNDLANSNEK